MTHFLRCASDLGKNKELTTTPFVLHRTTEEVLVKGNTSVEKTSDEGFDVVVGIDQDDYLLRNECSILGHVALFVGGCLLEAAADYSGR